MNKKFWNTLDDFLKNSNINIDRPRGSTHPRFDDYVYPFDYGELTGTQSADGDAVDVWVGSLGQESDITGIIVIADGMKRDSEIKVLIGCTEKDADIILSYQNRGQMAGLLLMRN